MSTRIIAYIFTLMIVLAAPIQAHAEGQSDETQFAFAPVPADNPAVTAKGYFVYQMQYGSSTSGQVRLRNTGTRPITVELAAVDATTAQTGGSAFATEASPNGIAQWVHLDEQQVTLQPNAEQNVGFTVLAPTSVKPGQYLAGIAALSKNTPSAPAATVTAKQVGAAINLQKRYVIAVQADIAGSWTPALNIDAVNVLARPTGTYIGVQMQNNGTTFIKPSGSLILTSAEGKQILSQPIKMGTFVTGTNVEYPIAWPETPQAGKYKVAVNLTYGDGKTATYSNEVEISSQEAARSAEVAKAAPGAPQVIVQPSPIKPWMIYGVGGLLALVVVLLTLNLRRAAATRKTA